MKIPNWLKTIIKFLLGVLAGMIGLQVLRSRQKPKTDTSVPEKPKPSLTEETREKIREEIHSDSARELARRLIKRLGGRKD